MALENYGALHGEKCYSFCRGYNASGIDNMILVLSRERCTNCCIKRNFPLTTRLELSHIYRCISLVFKDDMRLVFLC